MSVGRDPSYSELKHTGNPDTSPQGSDDNFNQENFLKTEVTVYDDTLISPLISASLETGRPPCTLARVWGLMLINLGLQFTILYQIAGPNGLVDRTLSETRMGMFGKPGRSKGLCYWQNGTTVPQFNQIGAHRKNDGRYLNCIPDEVFLLYNFSGLDLDGDGHWTKKEAKVLENHLNSSQSPVSNMHYRIKTFIMDSAKAVSRQGAYADNIDVTHQVKSVQESFRKAPNAIPQNIFLSQIRPFLDMCVINDHRMCGNIMFRRSFNRTYFLKLFEASGFKGAPLGFLEVNPHSGGNVQDVMNLCTLATEVICPKFFSVQYAAAGRQRSELCGAATTIIQKLPNKDLETEYDELNQQLLTTMYERYEKYKNTVLSFNYTVFLFLILALFAMSILEEFRVIKNWWRTLWMMDAEEDMTKTAEVLNDEGEIKIKGITKFHRWTVMIFALVPRTLMMFCVLLAGSRFLVLSDGYADLIMNSLALTFLITVDEIVCKAFVPKRRQHWLENCGNLQAARPHFKCTNCLLEFFNGEVYAIFIVLFVACVMGVEYKRQYGKENLSRALRCVCQLAGEDCTAAQILGGYVNVAMSPNYQSPYESAGSWFGF